MSQSREIVLDRKERVKELYFVKRQSMREVAEALDWSIPTILKKNQNNKKKNLVNKE